MPSSIIFFLPFWPGFINIWPYGEQPHFSKGGFDWFLKQSFDDCPFLNSISWLVLFWSINIASKWRKLHVHNHWFHWLYFVYLLSFVSADSFLTFASWTYAKSFLNFSRLYFFLNLSFSLIFFFCFSPYTVSTFQHLWVFFLPRIFFLFPSFKIQFLPTETRSKKKKMLM